MVERRNSRLFGSTANHEGPSRRPRCGYCGKPYSGNGDACRACTDLFTQIGYIPQWDQHFIDKLADVYLRSFGQHVKASRVLGCTAADVRDGRKILMRWGFIFEGDRHKGTRLVGWSRTPPKVAVGGSRGG